MKTYFTILIAISLLVTSLLIGIMYTLHLFLHVDFLTVFIISTSVLLAMKVIKTLLPKILVKITQISFQLSKNKIKP